ncbi:phosphonate ABC transporter ATP-binding protein [Virgibacillus oceani]
MSILQVEHLNKVYPNGTEALKDISFRIEKGESVIILGHNGSGKSTLFRCVTGFEKPTKGSVNIFDRPLHPISKKELRNVRKNIGMVFQNFGLIHNLSVFQNVLFGAMGKTTFAFQTFSSFASSEWREKAMDAVERVGLVHVAKRRADQLSGGQKQRIAIARMLMQEPEVILADEPIASLDPKAGKEVMDLLWSIVEEKNLTVIAVLHQLEIAKEYGKRIIALKEGNKIIDADKDGIDETFLNSIYDLETTQKKYEEVNVRKIGGIEYSTFQ